MYAWQHLSCVLSVCLCCCKYEVRIEKPKILFTFYLVQRNTQVWSKSVLSTFALRAKHLAKARYSPAAVKPERISVTVRWRHDHKLSQSINAKNKDEFTQIIGCFFVSSF